MFDLSLWTMTEVLFKFSMYMMMGLYFIFSNTVMETLARFDNGADVMIEINKEILNPVFLSLFFVSGIGSFWLFFFSQGAIAAAGLIFFVGTVAVTVVFNVPLNDKLKNIVPNKKHALWKEYLSKWVLWNHVRTFCAAISGLLLCL